MNGPISYRRRPTKHEERREESPNRLVRGACMANSYSGGSMESLHSASENTATVMGRVVERLMSKGVLDADDVRQICGVYHPEDREDDIE